MHPVLPSSRLLPSPPTRLAPGRPPRQNRAPLLPIPPKNRTRPPLPPRGGDTDEEKAPTKRGWREGGREEGGSKGGRKEEAGCARFPQPKTLGCPTLFPNLPRQESAGLESCSCPEAERSRSYNWVRDGNGSRRRSEWWRSEAGCWDGRGSGCLEEAHAQHSGEAGAIFGTL